MSFPHDLLEQSESLARRERKRPKQASLRRAISTAYYALFHLLLDEVSQVSAPIRPDGLRKLVKRALGHTEMKSVCKAFISANNAFVSGKQNGELSPSTRNILHFPLEPELILVMSAFVDMQEARHNADYNTSASFTRVGTLSKINDVNDAFNAWKLIRKTENASVFKSALLLQKQWGR